MKKLSWGFIFLLLSCSSEFEKTVTDLEKRLFFDDTDFQKMPPPKPGDWLYHFPEKEQTFSDYVSTAVNRKSPRHNKIYILPIGELDQTYQKILEKMKEYAEIFFGCETQLLEPVPYFEDTYNSARKQYNASKILNRISKMAMKDAIAFVGITNRDLYVESLNFVFGVGQNTTRCGVYSLVRLETQNFNLFLKRALKLMSHEIGHILSISHCVKYKCVMNGSNSLAEADSRPMFLCPSDLRKLHWAMGFEPVERYEKLLAFFSNNGLQDEVSWLRKRLEKLK